MAPARPLPLFWRLLEEHFRRRYDIRVLENDPEALIAYNLWVYGGPEVLLNSGEEVRKGDRVMELHFRREALLPLIADGDPRRVGLALKRLGERDLPRLTRALETDPELREVAAMHALTLFHRGIDRMGFEVHAMENRLAERWFSWYHQVLMARDAKEGAQRVKRHREKLVTRHIWVTRESLIRRWPPSPSPPP